MPTCWKVSSSSIACLLAVLPCSLQAQHYGFGLIKKTVTLQRRLLPDVRLGQDSVAVVFPRGPGGLDANVFTSDLETQVAQNSGGIRLVSTGPEYEIRCYTTAYQPAQITSRTEAAPKFLGKAGKPVTDREAHGNIALDARLTRVADGSVLAAFSESVTLNASSTSGGGSSSATTFNLPTVHIPGMHTTAAGQAAAPAADPLPDTDTNASLNNKMLKTLALRVASHLVQMDEQITVLLGQGGALDEPSRLAVNGRWSEYLEKLSAITPPSDPADNAYLLYNLGVANEALGYAAGDAKATLKYLQESSIDYTRATEAKPAEKYFADPQKRIETAITRYTRLAEQERAPAPKRQEPEHRAKAGERLTNADVVRLVKAHIDKSLILNKIATASEASFDLSVNGMVSLSQSGVPSDVIRAMSARSQQQEPESAR